jgi:hypothetical protein
VEINKNHPRLGPERFDLIRRLRKVNPRTLSTPTGPLAVSKTTTPEPGVPAG